MLSFFKCTNTGDVCVSAYDQGEAAPCCDSGIEKLEPNSSGAAVEKHMPVATVSGNAVEVKVGEVAHPMGAEHLITFICLETK